MQINPIVTQANGVISIRLQAQFIGDVTDSEDKANIAAYGDPQISLVGNGTFNGTVPGSSPPAVFSFTFPSSEYYVGITTQMSTKTVRFMQSLPPPPVNERVPGYCQGYHGGQGPLDCLTPYPAAALESWWVAMQNSINTALTALRNLSLVPPLGPVDL